MSSFPTHEDTSSLSLKHQPEDSGIFTEDTGILPDAACKLPTESII